MGTWRKSSPKLKTRVWFTADATRQGWLGGVDEATPNASDSWFGNLGTSIAEEYRIAVLLGILEGTIKFDVWVGVHNRTISSALKLSRPRFTSIFGTKSNPSTFRHLGY